MSRNGRSGWGQILGLVCAVTVGMAPTCAPGCCCGCDGSFVGDGVLSEMAASDADASAADDHAGTPPGLHLVSGGGGLGVRQEAAAWRLGGRRRRRRGRASTPPSSLTDAEPLMEP